MTDRRAKVLRMITRLNIGGPAIQALLLTRELASEYPTVLAAGYPQPGEGELTDPEVAVQRVPLVRPVRPHRDAVVLARVRALMIRSGARLLHTHMAKAGTIGRLAAATVRRRIVTVHTFHGHVLEGYFSIPVQRAFLAIERTLARRTDALVAVSDEVRDSLLNLGIGRLSQWHVIPLGFDLSRFLTIDVGSGTLRKALGLPAEAPLVGILGRLAPIKDHTTLLRAVASLPGVHLAILGDGEQRAALERLSRSLGVADRVHLMGWWEDVPAAIADMDVVALTSLNEGSPVSLIEALAAARPVVATDVGGVRSVVQDGRTGYLARPGDEATISTSLKRLLEDEVLRAAMGAEGRRHVRERFDKKRLISDVRALYEELLRR